MIIREKGWGSAAYWWEIPSLIFRKYFGKERVCVRKKKRKI
jgi:hypothetical protein